MITCDVFGSVSLVHSSVRCRNHSEKWKISAPDETWAETENIQNYLYYKYPFFLFQITCFVFLSLMSRALMLKGRKALPTLPRPHKTMGCTVSGWWEKFHTGDLTLLTFGCLPSEGSSVDSDAAVPQSHRPLIAAVKPGPETAAGANSLQAPVETPSMAGQSARVLQHHAALQVFMVSLGWASSSTRGRWRVGARKSRTG